MYNFRLSSRRSVYTVNMADTHRPRQSRDLSRVAACRCSLSPVRHRSRNWSRWRRRRQSTALRSTDGVDACSSLPHDNGGKMGICIVHYMSAIGNDRWRWHVTYYNIYIYIYIYIGINDGALIVTIHRRRRRRRLLILIFRFRRSEFKSVPRPIEKSVGTTWSNVS